MRDRRFLSLWELNLQRANQLGAFASALAIEPGDELALIALFLFVSVLFPKDIEIVIVVAQVS
ncbi:MAG: hypothetical protein ABF381_15705 [Akkermansiaceae bacterium]